MTTDSRFPFPLGATLESAGRRYTLRSYTRAEPGGFNMVVGRINPDRPEQQFPVGETIPSNQFDQFTLIDTNGQ